MMPRDVVNSVTFQFGDGEVVGVSNVMVTTTRELASEIKQDIKYKLWDALYGETFRLVQALYDDERDLKGRRVTIDEVLETLRPPV